MKRGMLCILLTSLLSISVFSLPATYIAFNMDGDEKLQSCELTNYADAYVKQLCTEIGIGQKNIVMNDFINRLAEKGYKIISYSTIQVARDYYTISLLVEKR